MYFSMAYVAAALGWHVLRLTQSHPKRSLVVVAIRNLRRFTLFNQCCRSSDLPFSPAVSGSQSEPEALSPKPKHNQNTESNDSIGEQDSALLLGRGMTVSTVEARKLEHQCPHALKVKYRGSQH